MPFELSDPTFYNLSEIKSPIRTSTMNYFANLLCIPPLRNISENNTKNVMKHEKHNVVFSIIYSVVQTI